LDEGEGTVRVDEERGQLPVGDVVEVAEGVEDFGWGLPHSRLIFVQPGLQLCWGHIPDEQLREVVGGIIEPFRETIRLHELGDGTLILDVGPFVDRVTRMGEGIHPREPRLVLRTGTDFEEDLRVGCTREVLRPRPICQGFETVLAERFVDERFR
jgi:hypothetical protein